LTSREAPDRIQLATRYDLAFPTGTALDQDEEWCLVRENGETRKLRFHDYGEIYELPGLYEQLFYDHLKCTSPATVARLLERELRLASVDPGTLRLLDVGAGNGMVGEQLAEVGVGTIVGIDLIPEAAAAAERDRPGIYDDYLTLDLTALDPGTRRGLESRRLNALTCVAALGFGDIPPVALAAAYDLLEPDSWLAFSIKEGFLEESGGSGFAHLVRELVGRGMMEIRTQRRYRHRLAANGEPVHYVAVVAVKRSPEPAAALAAAL
jgi:predicted TPR repeat methyltransferase